jgi:rubrerythrin
MKKIYSSQDVSEIEILRGLLAEEGIETTVLNEDVGEVAGMVPFDKAMPELWVKNDDEEGRALEIVKKMDSGEIRKSLGGQPWKCPQCGEAIERQFTACWKCGTKREGASGAGPSTM